MRIHLSHAQASALHLPTSGKAIELYDVQLVASLTAIEGSEQQSANPEADELRRKVDILTEALAQSSDEIESLREQLAQIPPQEEKQPAQPEKPESEPKKRGK